ncbi:PACE efflux transporter [Leucobacter chromiireducens]|uniref:PACE efflux transporter n=1 Tax=Leucobacter chromiireducens TaxID=283877 RepID=UPI0019CF866E|nr:PACE efflux transporter [Leucobacter chromiireducens]
MTATGHTSSAFAPTLSTVADTLVEAVDTATLRIAGAAPAERQLRFFQARPVLRRVAFVAGYEGLSVLFTVVVLSSLLGHGGGQSTLTAVLLSTTATIWNYVWNTIFEAIERRTGATGRGVGSRALHAIGYEGGVLVFTIPLVMFMLGLGLIEAILLEGGLLIFFLVFTVVYTWAFDRVFGLPASALTGAEAH